MEENIGSPTRPVGTHKKAAAGEVDYKTKSGTAWSHNYLNQKPWHPLSYPNQRRKWIAEQTDAQRKLRAEEIAREFAQEQEFFRQTALVSKKEKEKMEMMKAVSFMYVRPPGYNAESAKAAEIADEEKKLEQIDHTGQQQTNAPPTMPEVGQGKDNSLGERKKDRPKDVFGRALPSEEDFEVLKNAPRMDTGVPVRIKPFAVEIRNVRCVRCGNYGHQSGDRECLLKDAIMPNDESRLKRDDPLRAMMAHTDASEPIKWELKQRPGMSPPRGGFQPDDPNQQIVPDDIFDEYGGFLGGGGIPSELLTSIGARKIKKHSSRNGKSKQRSLASDRKVRSSADRSSSSSSTDTADVEPTKSKSRRAKRKRRQYENSDPSETSSEQHDSDAEVLRRLKSKCAKRMGQHNQESYPWETYSARRHQIRHSASPSSSSSDSRSQMRRLKRKHLIKRDHSLQSDHDSGKGESSRKTERKGRRYHDDSSRASGDDNWERHSGKRKHQKN